MRVFCTHKKLILSSMILSFLSAVIDTPLQGQMRLCGFLHLQKNDSVIHDSVNSLGSHRQPLQGPRLQRLFVAEGGDGVDGGGFGGGVEAGEEAGGEGEAYSEEYGVGGEDGDIFGGGDGFEDFDEAEGG